MHARALALHDCPTDILGGFKIIRWEGGGVISHALKIKPESLRQLMSTVYDHDMMYNFLESGGKYGFWDVGQLYVGTYLTRKRNFVSHIDIS